MKKKHRPDSQKHPDGSRGHGNNQHPSSTQDEGSQKAAAFQARSQLGRSYGSSGALAKAYPDPWRWDDHGVLRDRKGSPIPGVDRIQVRSGR